MWSGARWREIGGFLVRAFFFPFLVWLLWRRFPARAGTMFNTSSFFFFLVLFKFNPNNWANEWWRVWKKSVSTAVCAGVRRNEQHFSTYVPVVRYGIFLEWSVKRLIGRPKPSNIILTIGLGITLFSKLRYIRYRYVILWHYYIASVVRQGRSRHIFISTWWVLPQF